MDYRQLDLIWRALISGGLFLASLGLCLWIYWASGTSRRGAVGWRILGTAAVLFTLPSLVLSAFNLDVAEQTWINPLFYVSLVGAVATVAVTIGFSLAERGQSPGLVGVDEWHTPTDAAEWGQGGWDAGRPGAPPTLIEDAAMQGYGAQWGGGAGSQAENSGLDWSVPTTGAGAAPTIVRGGAPANSPVGAGHTIMLDQQQATGSLAYLVERSGPRPGRPYLLAPHTLIGRAPDCTIRLDAGTVTARHASLRQQPNGSWVIKDLDSGNGTFLLRAGSQKAERVDQATLQEPDVVRLGDCELIFMEVADTDEAGVDLNAVAGVKPGEAGFPGELDATIRYKPLFETREMPAGDTTQVRS